jgi:tRNA(Ser,Leu) C12 N-acetylase TAN1
VEEDEVKGGDSDELEKEITEIWDRIKHEPFKEAKAFQVHTYRRCAFTSQCFPKVWVVLSGQRWGL